VYTDNVTSSGLSITERPPAIQALEQQLGDNALTANKRSELMAELAWELRRLDTQASLELAEEAYVLALENNYKTGLAASLLARGFARSRLAQYEQAQQDAQQAYNYYEELNNGIGSYRALNLLGVTYGQLGDFSKALRTFLETHMLCEMLGEHAGAAAALNNAALTHTYLSDYASALELHLRALKDYEKLKDQEGMARTLANIGSAYMELARYHEALESFQKALDAQGQWHDKLVNASILMTMGRSYFEINDLDNAQSCILKSQNYFKALGDEQGISQTQLVLGLINLKTGKLDQAIKQLKGALESAKKIGDRLCEAQSGLELAKSYLLNHNVFEAEALLLHTLQVAKAIESKAEVYKVHLSLAGLYESQKDFEEALFHQKAYGQLKDDVFNAASDHKFQSLQISFQVEQAERENEIFRLRNVELAQANQKLQSLNESLKDLNAQKSQLLTKLERQALEDPLTGLFNRRHFDEQTSKLFSIAQLEQKRLSIMICDIDNFKSINDTYSHQVGDEVLIKVAQLFRDNVRASDVLARYGGEEFILTMPDTSTDLAIMVCERLRKAIESYAWSEINPNLKVTISLGLASDVSVESFEKMIAFADEKLYEAKRSGKNKLCV